MSQYGKSGEESMEEILASIRSSVDTHEDGSVAQNSISAANNGAVGGARPGVTNSAPRAGSGRLQDALSHVNVAAPVKPPQGVAPAAAPNQASATPPAPSSGAPIQTPPLAAPSAPPLSANPSAGLNDLSDLFADPAPTPGAKAPSPTSANAPSAAPFGTVVKQNPSAVQTGSSPTPVVMQPTPTAPVTAAPIASSAPLSSAEAAALVKPAAVQQAEPEASAAPEVIASMQSPEPAPVQLDSDPKPKREPSFAALKTLATGKPPEKDPPTASAETGDTSSVLLPEMRDLPGTNPVAQMHSMVGSDAQSKAGGFIPAATTSAAANGSADDDAGEAPTEIVSAALVTTLGSASPDSTRDGGDGAGLTPDASVAAASGSRNLEDIVVELLKPQLARWLEANMPRIVERALRAEQQGSSDKDSS